MKVAYFYERTLVYEWANIHKRYPSIQFGEIHKEFFDGQYMTVFLHFGKKELEDKHIEKFKEVSIFSNHKMKNDLIVFGPTNTQGEFGTTFNEYILKHANEFRNAEFVTIREDGSTGKLMSPDVACITVLESLK